MDLSRTILLKVKPNKSSVLKSTLSLLFFLSFFASPVAAQKTNKPTGPLLTRTTTRHETARLPFGGTVTLSAAPAGSIVIEGWQRNEVEVNATIELQAPTAADLDRLAAVNTFIVDEDLNHIRILTTGTHDRAFMKRNAKNFPKALIGLPWKVDFVIRIPALTDLSVDAGNGPIKLSGIEGALRLNALVSDADLSLTGGLVSVLIQGGTLNLKIPARGWHGLGAEIRLASGAMNVALLPGFSADIVADVLRAGEIKITYPDLQPNGRNGITSKSVRARAGSGGATLNFTIGDGTMAIVQNAENGKQ
jgi:hypothetical protein